MNESEEIIKDDSNIEPPTEELPPAEEISNDISDAKPIDETADDITEEQQEEEEEVVEEPCIKKFAYDTTDKDEVEPSSSENLTVQEKVCMEIVERKLLIIF